MLVGVLGGEETPPWARQCDRLRSTTCTVLLREFVSRNAWPQHKKLPFSCLTAWLALFFSVITLQQQDSELILKTQLIQLRTKGMATSK